MRLQYRELSSTRVTHRTGEQELQQLVALAMERVQGLHVNIGIKLKGCGQKTSANIMTYRQCMNAISNLLHDCLCQYIIPALQSVPYTVYHILAEQYL